MPTVAVDGSIKIPKNVRKQLGVQPGDIVEFIVDENNDAVLIRKHAFTNPFDRYRGLLGKAKTEQIMEDLRQSD